MRPGGVRLPGGLTESVTLDQELLGLGEPGAEDGPRRPDVLHPPPQRGLAQPGRQLVGDRQRSVGLVDVAGLDRRPRPEEVGFGLERGVGDALHQGHEFSRVPLPLGEQIGHTGREVPGEQHPSESLVVIEAAGEFQSFIAAVPSSVASPR